VTPPDDAPDLNATSSGRALRDIVGQLVQRGANLVLGVAVTVVLVRGLGEEDFGRWATAFVVVQMVGFLGDLSLAEVTVNRAAAEPDPVRSQRWVNAFVTLRIAVALPAMAVTLAVLLAISDTHDMRLTSVVLTSTILVGALGAAKVVFQLRVRNSLVATTELANGVLWGVAVFVLAALDAGLVAFALAFTLAALATTLGQAYLAHREVGLAPVVDRVAWRDLARSAMPVAISGIILMSIAKIDQVLVFQIAGERDAGLYAAAYRIIDSGMIVPATVLATIFPLLAAARATDPARVTQLLQSTLELISTVTLPICAVSLVAARTILTTLFGEEFAGASVAFSLLMLSFGVSGFGYLTGHLVLVFGLQRRFVRYSASALALNVTGNLLLIGPLGIDAAAALVLVTQMIVIGPMFVFIVRDLEHRLDTSRLARLAGCSALAAAAAWLAQDAGGGLAGVGAASFATYVAAVLLTRTWTPAQLQAALRPTAA